jgi:hypothetical protein
MPRAVIVGGAGCTGLVSALYLAESGGVDVTLYVRPERVPQLGKMGIPSIPYMSSYLYLVASDRISSDLILSLPYLIVSYLIVSYLISAYRTLSDFIGSCLILSSIA